MELSIIRWSIAGSTSNFKMNITHFPSVEVNGSSSRVFKENLLSYRTESADRPYIFFSLCLFRPPYPEYIMTFTMFHFLVLINPSEREKILLLGR